MFLREIEGFQKIHIGDIVDADSIKKAAQIYEEGLGQKYISEEDLRKLVENKDKYIVIGAYWGNELVGAMIAFPLSFEESERYNGELYENRVPGILASHNVGLIKSIAVQKEFRHRGIGTQLTLEAMSRLKNKGCDLFFAVSWVSGVPDSSQHMFEDLGYENALRVDNYWTEDSKKEKYMCPICGNPCYCSAIFYFKKA